MVGGVFNGGKGPHIHTDNDTRGIQVAQHAIEAFGGNVEAVPAPHDFSDLTGQIDRLVDRLLMGLQRRDVVGTDVLQYSKILLSRPQDISKELFVLIGLMTSPAHIDPEKLFLGHHNEMTWFVALVSLVSAGSRDQERTQEYANKCVEILQRIPDDGVADKLLQLAITAVDDSNYFQKVLAELM